MIPTKRNRKVQIAIDGAIYALRNRIGRVIGRLKNAPGLRRRSLRRLAPPAGAMSIQPPRRCQAARNKRER